MQNSDVNNTSKASDINCYKTVSSKKVFEGHIIDVSHDVITLPDGNTTNRETVLRGNATATVPVDSKNNVILVKQYRHPAKKILLEIPAGMMEEGEDPVECALRELEEETSFKANKIQHLTSMYPTAGFCTEILHIYLCTELGEGKFNFDDDEFLEVVKMPLDDAIEMIYTGEIIDSKTIIGLLACKKYL